MTQCLKSLKKSHCFKIWNHAKLEFWNQKSLSKWREICTTFTILSRFLRLSWYLFFFLAQFMSLTFKWDILKWLWNKCWCSFKLATKSNTTHWTLNLFERQDFRYKTEKKMFYNILLSNELVNHRISMMHFL